MTTHEIQLTVLFCSPLHMILVLLEYIRWEVDWRLGLFSGVTAPESPQWIH